jgi:hypothetical protein
MFTVEGARNHIRIATQQARYQRSPTTSWRPALIAAAIAIGLALAVWFLSAI